MNPEMTAEEQSIIELLTRLPAAQRKSDDLWNRVHNVFEANGFAAKIAHILTFREHEQLEEIHYEYAAAWLKSKGMFDDAKEIINRKSFN